MASETADHSNVSQQEEKKVLEEVKTMEENVPQQPKETEEIEKPKEEEVLIPLTKAEVEEKPKADEPIVAAEEKVEDKQIEIHYETEEIKKPDIYVPGEVEEPKNSVAEVVTKGDQPEKPQEELVKKSGVDGQEIEVPEPAMEMLVETKEEKPEELPEKSEVLDVSPPEAEVVPEKNEVPASVTEVVEKEEEKTDTQESGTKLEEPAVLPERNEIPESTTETVDVKELISKTEIPESLIAESKEVQPEELSSKEPETEVVKDVEVPAAEVIKEAAAPEPEDKQEEKPESAAPVEEKPDEKLVVESENDKEISSNEIKDAVAESVVSHSSDQVTSIPEKIHVVEKNLEVPPPLEGAEKTIVEDKEREVAKTESIESVKVEEKIESEDKTGVPKESALPEDVPTTLSQEAGKIMEQTSREIELPAENGSKNDESTKDNVEIEKKVNVVDHLLPKDEPETKTEEPPIESKIKQEEKEVKEPAKTDAPVEEPTKETEELKTVQEVPKKQSNNLLAKMKHSLAKAKKAITGKSQSKTPPPTETKDEVKAI